MNRLLSNPLRLAVGLLAGVAVLAGLGFAFRPSAMIPGVQDHVARKTGHTLDVVGGASYSFAPGLVLTLYDAKLTSGGAGDGHVVMARHVAIPLTIGGLLTGRIDPSVIDLDGAEIIFAPTEDGKVGMAAEDGSDAKVSGAPAADGAPAMTINLHNSSLHYLVAGGETSYQASNVEAAASFSKSGEITVQGTATAADQPVAFSLYLASLARLPADGSPFDFTVDSGSDQLTFNGRLSTRAKINLAGQASITITKTGPVLRNLGLPLPGERFSLAGGLSSTGGRFTMRNGELVTSQMTAKGDLTLDLDGPRARLSAKLATDALALAAPQTGAAKPAGTASTPALWNEDSFDLSLFQRFDGDVEISSFKTIIAGANAGPATLALHAQDGTLQADARFENLFGGVGEAQVNVVSPGAAALFTLSLNASAVELSALMPQLGISGAGDIDAQLTATGNSAARLVSSLGGSAKLALADGQIKGLNLNDAVGAISRAVLHGWPHDANVQTAVTAASASFVVSDGIAATEDLSITGETLQVSGTGEVDLLRQAIDLRVDPRLLSPGEAATKLPVQVLVVGPWQRPKIYPDIDGIMEDPVRAYDALKDMGLTTAVEGTAKKALKKGKKLINKLTGN